MLTIIAPNKELTPWINALLTLEPTLEISVWPDKHPDTEMVLCWNPPMGCFNEFPNLKCICSMGAGVDHILKDPDIPEQIQIVRLIDDNLNLDMYRFVRHCVEDYRLRCHLFRAAQNNHQWSPQPPIKISELTISILGLGAIGSYVAQQLAAEGYPVSGWSTSTKNLSNIKTFEGDSGLVEMISNSRLIICILPLTPETQGILSKPLFQKLHYPSCLINVARGGHLNEDDLLEALSEGLISRAYLDVFETEPLNPSHAFWDHPDIQITPHIASLTRPESVAKAILANHKSCRNNNILSHTVVRPRGY